MSFACGIVGLPNVGKSTLFNALTRSQLAQAANYPFCTIEPNIAEAPAPDSRLDAIATLAKAANTIYARVRFIDIAGLAPGASKGEGLGNRFLGDIRNVDAIVHVLRCFEGDTTHIQGRVDPRADAELVETELALADLASLETRIQGLVRRARGPDKEAKRDLAMAERARDLLAQGGGLNDSTLTEEDHLAHKRLQLLCAKPMLYVLNVDEGELVPKGLVPLHAQAGEEHARGKHTQSLRVCAAMEEQLASLSDEDRAEWFAQDGATESGLARLARAGFAALDRIAFFTAGPKEARAWSIKRGTTAQDAAGAIHDDFRRGFIRAETIGWQEYLALGGERAAREQGALRAEGRDYVVQDGDVMRFLFKV